MTYRADAIVIGAGVVGLACARRLALAGLETIMLEKDSRFGRGISSRNSEVIHAGIYYAPGSLKARLCREGRYQLYSYCRSRHVNHRKTGKWIVATRESQVGTLQALQDNALHNGVEDIAILAAVEARRIEPELRCVAALNSPSTGIIDSYGLMTALLGDFETAGGVVAFRSAVKAATQVNGAVEVVVDDTEQTRIQTRYLINAAGLDAPVVATCIEGFPAAQVPVRSYAKGDYFTLTGKSPFSRLVYPLPEPGGLGIHLTLDLQGRARFGPDIEWVTEPDYSVKPEKAENFAAAIREYWPACTRTRLQPAYAGIRPKLGKPEALGQDFVIQDASSHGVQGLINLFGIESPGLTSCLAIADEVFDRLNYLD
jgi:L-2-hydroxyglutarate oxidase LhgO